MNVPVWMSLLSDRQLSALLVCLRVPRHEHALSPEDAACVKEMTRQMEEEEHARQRVCEALAGRPMPWLP